MSRFDRGAAAAGGTLSATQLEDDETRITGCQKLALACGSLPTNLGWAISESLLIPYLLELKKENAKHSMCIRGYDHKQNKNKKQSWMPILRVLMGLVFLPNFIHSIRPKNRRMEFIMAIPQRLRLAWPQTIHIITLFIKCHNHVSPSPISLHLQKVK